MNMISTGAFLTEMDASDKQKSSLVNKLVSAWEQKNSKTARAGGVSLMALSLAACGSNDDSDGAITFTQAALDAAKALAAAEATEAAEAAAATAAEAAATAATAAENAATATAEAAAALAATAAAEAAAASEKVIQDKYDLLVAPKTDVLTTGTDTLVGASGNDIFTGAAGTSAAADTVIDASTTDSDSLTITDTASQGAITVTNIETVTMNLNSLSALTVDAQNINGSSVLNVNRGDVQIGGSTFAGEKSVVVNKVDGAGIAKIVVGTGTTTVNVNGEGAIATTGSSGIIIDADAATTDVRVDFNATVNAAAATGTVAIDGAVYTGVAQLAKASVINADAAATVTTSASLTGSVTVNAAKASTITVSNAQGGATIDGGTTSTADTTITVVDIDASGATITTGTGLASTAAGKQITLTLDGTTAATDTVTIAGAGVIALDVDATSAEAIDIINLSSTSGAVTYTMTVPAGGTDNTITSITGTSDVTIQGNENAFAGVTVANVSKIDMNAGTAGTIDADSWTGVTTIDLGFDNSGNAISYYQGQNYEVTKDQAGFTLDLKATGTAQTVTITAGDDNGTSAAVGTITLGAVDVDAGDDTVAGTVSLEASIANLTATSFDMGAKQNLVISGDEDVTLGTVTGGAASSIVSTSTGKISLTTTTLAPSVSTGSGADSITINGADVHTISTGDGNDTITISATSDTSSFDGGAGNDGFTITDVGANVVIGGLGNDTFTTGGVIDSIIVGGDGSDIFKLDATRDVSAKTNFAISGVETFNIAAGNLTMDATQFANNNTVAISANGDTFRVDVDATTGKTIDASNLTIAASKSATLTYFGNTGADTITGGVAAETINNSAGADTMSGGGTGTDTFVSQTGVTETGSANASTGAVVNLGSTTVTGTTIFAATGQYLSNNVANVGAGKADHVYAADLATNFSVIDAVSGFENITGTAGSDYIVGTTGNNTITGGDGVDGLIGGDGDDTFLGATADFVTGSSFEDTIDGGLGTNTIALNGATTFASTTDWTDNVSNINSITVNSAQTGVLSITTHATFASDTGIAIIDLSGDTSATGANVIDISNQTTTTAMALKGSAGVDTITGDAGSTDTITIAMGGTGVTVSTDDHVGGFTSATDKLALGTAGANTNYSEADGNATDGGGATVTDTFAEALAVANIAFNSTIKYHFLFDVKANIGGGASTDGLLFIDDDLDGTADDCITIDGGAASSNLAFGDIIA